MVKAPQIYIFRHGETAWSLTGQHTSVTDLPLTDNGKKRILATADALVGENRLIVPANVKKVYISPRKRAQQTYELLTHAQKFPNAAVQTTEDIREWDYGIYEGKKTAEVREIRKSHGLNEDWSIWSDGCEGGESPFQVQERLDRIIKDINELHREAIKSGDFGSSDVVIVAHGHILRAFCLRWVKDAITNNPSLILDAGGVGVLSYEHLNIEEPAICLGGAFTVPGER